MSRRQDLEGDEAVERRLPGLVDRAHAALAEQLEDLELQTTSGLQRSAAQTGPPLARASWPEAGLANPPGTNTSGASRLAIRSPRLSSRYSYASGGGSKPQFFLKSNEPVPRLLRP